MIELGKIIIFLGIGLVLIGLLIMALSKFGFVGRLPGDIYIKKENFSLYFPITSCILLSLAVSLIMFLISRK